MRSLSNITATFTESVIREMTRRCNAVGGINLAQGFPDFDTPAPVREAAVRAIRENRNQYPITFGEPALRDAIAKKSLAHNGIRCDPATEITVTCGATEAMMASLLAVINPGDEIVLFEPFYENYGPDSILSGATPRYVTLSPPDWTFRPDELAGAFNKKTKAVVLNTPNNPTGKVFTRVELDVIAALCRQWDCYAITDEIYEHIVYDGARHVAPATVPGLEDRTVTVNAISKTYSVTGWRVGWAIAPPPVTASIRKVHDFLTVGAPTPLQHAAVTALSLPPEYYRGLCDGYRRARDFLFDALSDLGFRPIRPAGAYYMMADVSALKKRFDAENDVEFAWALCEQAGVAAVPGSSFFRDPARGADYIRFCFCKTMRTLEGAVEALRKGL